MSLTTVSQFYYGYDVVAGMTYLNFQEGSGAVLTASVQIGSYSFTDVASAVQAAMNVVGGQAYTVTANRATRTFTISALGTFSLLAATGPQAASGVWPTIGFTAVDLTGAATYTGGLAGSAFVPQFILQDHIPSENWTGASLATVNKTASGRVEVIRFGTESFMQSSFNFITNLYQPTGSPIRYSTTGVQDFLAFANYLITKEPVEYMYNMNVPTTFKKVILESTPDYKDGTGFKLKEKYDIGLPGYYDSGTFVFRVVV